MKKKNRKQHFATWWFKNHHNVKAQTWLVRNAKRVVCSIYLPVEFHSEVHDICARFNKSEYKRLKQKDAWKLWKVCHPSKQQRAEALIQTAKTVSEQIDTLENLKREAQGKRPRRTQPPLVLETQ